MAQHYMKTMLCLSVWSANRTVNYMYCSIFKMATKCNAILLQGDGILCLTSIALYWDLIVVSAYSVFLIGQFMFV